MRREKSRRRRTIEALILAALLLFEVWAVDFVLTPAPNTAVQWSGIRATRGELDTLFLGSSHAHCAITPMEMWRASGVTGASITGPSQPLSITAAYLEEALHSQDPKVVMVEVCMIGRQQEESEVATLKSNLDYMPWGIPKVKAIARAMPSTEWPSTFFRLRSYHTRWTAITEREFWPLKLDNFWYMRGAYYLTSTTEIERLPLERRISEAAYAENLRWLRDMAERCEREDIQLVLYTAPPVRPVMEDGTPTLERLESDLDGDFPSVRYLDTNDYADEIGLDMRADFKDANHLNGPGATKLSRWLAVDLKQRYALVDHSGSAFAGDWNDDLILYDEYVALLQAEQAGATSEEFVATLYSLAWKTLDVAIDHSVRWRR